MEKIGKKISIVVLIFVSAILAFAGVKHVSAASGKMTVYAIDLGGRNTGEATMITAGDGGALLVDSGDNHNDSIFDWLDNNGYKKKKFNTLVTHWHDDHAGNTAEIIRKYNVGTVYIPTLSYVEKVNSPYYRYERSYAVKILAAAKARGTKVVYLKKGQNIKVGSGVSGKVLYVNGSPIKESEDPVSHINNESAVIMFSGGGCKYLNAADIQVEAENRLLKSGQSLQADIFKMSHHGYDTSNQKKFLNAIKPTYAYFTAHESSPDEYLASRVRTCVKRMSAMSNVFGTRYNGTIRFVCSGGKVNATARRNCCAMYEKLTSKSTGKTVTKKYIFNKKCDVKQFDSVVDTDTYYNQQVTSKGKIYTANWKKISGRWHLKESNGMQAYNTLAVKNGKYYFFDKSGRRLEKGWKKLGKYRYYFAPNRVEGFKRISGKVYYFGNQKLTGYKASLRGVMLVGFRVVDGKRYYMIDKRYKGYKASLYGVRASGWVTVANNIYYLDGSGIVQTGMKKIGSYYYYFAPGSGVMQKGLVKIGSDYYYFDKNGKRMSGWQTVSGKKYYFQTNGKALRSVDKTISNHRYRFDAKGVMIKEINCHLDSAGNPIVGWHEINGKKYYAYSDGELASGKVVIDGTEYEFDTVANGCALLTGVNISADYAGDTSAEAAPVVEPGTDADMAGPENADTAYTENETAPEEEAEETTGDEDMSEADSDGKTEETTEAVSGSGDAEQGDSSDENAEEQDRQDQDSGEEVGEGSGAEDAEEVIQEPETEEKDPETETEEAEQETDESSSTEQTAAAVTEG